MRKIIAVFAAVIAAACCLMSCASRDSRIPEQDGKIQVVTSIFPIYDWVRNILGDQTEAFDVRLLLDNGTDLHSFQPAAEDIMRISTCDLLIYVGGESDQWVSGALKEAMNKDMVVVDLMDVLGNSIKEEEIIEGMQDDHDHEPQNQADHDHETQNQADHDHEPQNQDDHDHETQTREDPDHETQAREASDRAASAEGYDEHVWLSLRNASILSEHISEVIRTLDPENSDIYKNNTAAYLEKLSALDAEYQVAADQAEFTTLLFGDRFPFRYLTDDYGLKYYAAFSGCSAEAEASFETITFLSQKMDELSLPAVMTIEGTDHRLAETIIQNTQSGDQEILTLNSMQSTTAKDIQNGMTYLGIMEENLAVLKKALQK